jgi:Zinc dependent phospholipase C
MGKTFRCQLRLLAQALLLLGLILAPGGASAFKSKAHVAMANQALLELDVTYYNAYIRGLGSVPIALSNSEVMDAIRAHPAAFRAGALGPDNFPDLISGQLWVHANRGRGGCPNWPCIGSGVEMESRSIVEWRSIDYGMYQLLRAQELLKTDPERARAIAFSYGYLAHQLSDGFAHAWVNEWTRTPWDYFEGQGIFGSLTDEIQHVAVESFLDKHLPNNRDQDLSIDVPVGFLNRDIYLSPLGSKPENASALGKALTTSNPAGAFAGVYYSTIIKAKNTLAMLGHRENWVTMGAEKNLATGAISNLLGATGQISHLLTFGTGFGDPVADLEDYFRRRSVALDALLHKWVVVSECTSQNLIRGANRPAPSPGTVPVKVKDACQPIIFEDTSELKEIFQGDLNKAAWYGYDDPTTDFGGLGPNLHKMFEVVKAVESFVIRLSLLKDVATIRKMAQALAWCTDPIVDWKACNNTCKEAYDACSSVAETIHCSGCPRKRGKYSCSPWYSRGVVCAAWPVCALCALNDRHNFVDGTCIVAVNGGSGGVCELCGPNSVCTAVGELQNVIGIADAALNDVLRPLVQKLKEEFIAAIEQYYFGDKAEEFILALKALEAGLSQSSPAWMVNVAFAAEDLRSEPNYLNRILTTALGLGETTVVIGADVASTVANTVNAARPILRAALDPGSTFITDAMLDEAWSHMVDILYRIAARLPNGTAADLLQEFAQSSPSWIDDLFAAPTNGEEARQLRLQHFLDLVTKTRLFAGIRGPTVLRLMGELGLDQTTDDWAAVQLIAPHEVHVLSNTVEAVKLGFLSAAGLDNLLAPYAAPNIVRSTICTLAPHIACDVVQSLDDPSDVRYTPGSSPSGDHVLENGVDRGLSVARWYSNKLKWEAGMFYPVPERDACDVALTDFPLASTQARADNLYDKIFVYPPNARCKHSSCAPIKTACNNNQCGIFGDGCGGFIGCPTCGTGAVCKTDRTCCTLANCNGRCGTVSDNCEGTIDCGGCGLGQACGTVTANTCGPSYEVGVIPEGKKCTNNLDSLEIYMDDEDSSTNTWSGGWLGGVEQNANTLFRFCRVDGRLLKPLGTLSSRPNNYAVLRLSTECPPGSVPFTRYIDNEDSRNTNYFDPDLAGNIFPNSSDRNTTLQFCLYRTGTPTMANFPDLGFPYGVFAEATFSRAIETGYFHSDDEDSVNRNGYWATAGAEVEAQALVSAGDNTDFRVAKVWPAVCTRGRALCSGRCESIQTDVNNCGTCGTKCPSGQPCVAGACICTPVTSCYGMCGTFSNGCGGSRVCSCSSGQACVAEVCQVACRAGTYDKCGDGRCYSASQGCL